MTLVIFKKLKKLVLPVVAQVQWQTGTLVSTLATAMDRLQQWKFLREMNGKNMEYWDRNMEYIDYEQESETLEWLRCEKHRCADIYQDQVKKARAELRAASAAPLRCGRENPPQLRRGADYGVKHRLSAVSLVFSVVCERCLPSAGKGFSAGHCGAHVYPFVVAGQLNFLRRIHTQNTEIPRFLSWHHTLDCFLACL